MSTDKQAKLHLCKFCGKQLADRFSKSKHQKTCQKTSEIKPETKTKTDSVNDPAQVKGTPVSISNNCPICGISFSDEAKKMSHIGGCKTAHIKAVLADLDSAKSMAGLLQKMTELGVPDAVKMAMVGQLGKMVPTINNPQVDIKAGKEEAADVKSAAVGSSAMPTATVNLPLPAIMPFVKGQEVIISVELVEKVYKSNLFLQQYAELPLKEQLDPEISTKYIIDAFVELVQIAHKRPEQCNVYINPARTNLVCAFMETGKWGTIPLVDAIRRIYDCLADQLTRLSEALPPAITNTSLQGAISSIALMYRLDPDKYNKEGKLAMNAYLLDLKSREGDFAVALLPPFEPHPSKVYKDKADEEKKIAEAARAKKKKELEKLVTRDMVMVGLAKHVTKCTKEEIRMFVHSIAVPLKRLGDLELIPEICRRLLDIIDEEDEEVVPKIIKARAKAADSMIRFMATIPGMKSATAVPANTKPAAASPVASAKKK